LTAISREILARRLQTPGRWIFPSAKNPGEHIGAHQRLHGAALKRAKVSFVPYDFRHTFATRAIERGIDVPTLAAIMGHANLRSIGKYVHISRQQMDVGMARFEAAESLPGPCLVSSGQKGENEGFAGNLREGSGNAQVQ
jgi:integrase